MARATVAAGRDAVSKKSWRKALLACGIASSLLYGAMIWGIRYEGYSLVSQVPSELTAIGAPTQRLWALLGPIYTLLVTAFGWGVWQSAGRNRIARTAGALILAFGSLGLLWPFAPMHQREVLAAGGGTLCDTMHVVLGGVTVLLMFLAIGFGAAAFGRRFRLYSIISSVVLLAFGVLTFLEAPRLEANLPTPWIGLWERINITVFLLWVVVLATGLLRAPKPARYQLNTSPQPRAQQAQNMPDMMKMHEQMMADMAAANAKLDALVKDMSAASGDAKVAAMAAVLTELVRQHASMHERMGQMHREMVAGPGRMMNR